MQGKKIFSQLKSTFLDYRFLVIYNSELNNTEFRYDYDTRLNKYDKQPNVHFCMHVR